MPPVLHAYDDFGTMKYDYTQRHDCILLSTTGKYGKEHTELVYFRLNGTEDATVYSQYAPRPLDGFKEGMRITCYGVLNERLVLIIHSSPPIDHIVASAFLLSLTVLSFVVVLFFLVWFILEPLSAGDHLMI